ncbi:GGDEF domain-containing protein [Aquabacter cavernae]|uniref:GGDEF domain-containing protein n=1 Tax=Aquabacter cavernae TaxID=2496029 RepID=UPI000F8E474E|nr:diguanylate cyclase [Aquabacter cavernae]
MLINNFVLLFADMAVYFGLMLALFRARRFIGIGGLFCALGTLHFITAYLGSSFFFQMPFGLGVSPGGVVLYSGFISLLLLTYLCEGTFVARQPVYGLLLGSFLLMMVGAILGFDHTRLPYNRPADITFLNQMAALMLWGTLLVFLECTFVFRLFNWFMARLGERLWLCLWLTLILTCTFDQILFFPALYYGFDVPLGVGIGNWLGKLGATAFYAGLMVFYLRHMERLGEAPVFTPERMRITKGTVRYDPETGAFHRSCFSLLLQDLLSVSVATGRPLTLLLITIDLEKLRTADPAAAGAALRRMVEAANEGLRAGDYVVRADTNMLAVLAPGLPHRAAFQVAAMMRQRIDGSASLQDAPVPTYAVGIATTPSDGESVQRLLSAAERRVYAARAQGAGRVVGAFEG